jgi:uncharacterized protein
MRIRTAAAIPALLATGLLITVAAPQTHGARAASFNCAQAGTETEQAICGDPALSQLDGAIGAAYAQRLAADPSVRQIQRGWLKARNVGCGKDADCLGHLMTHELKWLRSSGRWPASLPTVVGSCSLSAISKVSTRLDEPGSGTQIFEANGATEVSYDQMPPADVSRRGDPALVCLVSLPEDCPPGDDRGKTYAVTNLRTLGAWSAPDSEHMCGGA